MCPMACSLFGGCSCKEGYARDSNRRCILKSQCPGNVGTLEGDCPPGSQIVNCFADPCLTATCPGQPQAQCRADYCGGCKSKWFLDGSEVTNQCRQNEGSKTCGPDEEHLDCGSACPPQCGDELMGACIAVCKSGCFCKNGLVRNPANNRCIRRSECPANNTTAPRCATMLCAPGKNWAYKNKIYIWLVFP